MFADASNFVSVVDSAFIFILAICVFFLVLITACMIIFIVKYRRSKSPKGTNIHGSVFLEITWTVVPVLLVLVMFWIGWTGYKKMSTPPPDAMDITINGQMWRWQFDYGNGVVSDTLYLPLNQPVRAHLHSKDVNHSFYVAAFRVKQDVIPNRNNYIWFKPTELGEFSIECAEYCGMNHSYMRSRVVVLPQNNFNFWLNNMASKAGADGAQVASVDTAQSQMPAQADSVSSTKTGTSSNQNQIKKVEE